MRWRILTVPSLLILAVLCAAKPAGAQCTSPAKPTGTLEYFSADNIYKFCNGTAWVPIEIDTTLGACTKEAETLFDAAEGAYKYCSGGSSYVKFGCVAGGGGTCPDELAEWGNSATLNKPVPVGSDLFGVSVAVSGNVAVVGADQDDPGAISAAGTAYVFNTATGALTATLNNPAPTANDNFGFSVAVSGTTAVVGAYGDDPGGVNAAGTAYVFDTTTGALTATLNNPDPTAFDLFGVSVAVSGNVAVVGADQDDPGAISAAGTAYVFNTATGALTATLNNPAPTANDNFGFSVAVSGTTAVVGAYGDDPGGVSAAGTAYVFDTTTGALTATLNNPDPTADDNFGFSVAVSGTTAVVGAYFDESDGTATGVSNAGRAYVFDTTTGSLITALNNPNPDIGDNFGYSVAVSGTTAVVGAYRDGPGGISTAGTAYVFDTATGTLISTLNNPEPTISDEFGTSVAVSGNVAVVGADQDDPGAISAAGTAYVFDTATGTLISTLDNPDPTASDFFGTSVAVSGTVAVIGTSQNDPGGVAEAGTAYVFEDGLICASCAVDTAAGAASDGPALNNPDPTVSDLFGTSVAVSGTTAVVGAYQDDPGGVTSAGTAYVFDVTDGTLTTTLNNPAPATGDQFGRSMALSGNTAVVGAPNDSPAGAAHVFDVTTGSLVTTLTSPAPAGNDRFGWGVAVSGTTAVVGLPGNAIITNIPGIAYVFDTTDGTLTATLNNPDPTADDEFGYSVAVSGTTAVIGAPRDSPGGVNAAGTAYVFDTTDGSLIATLNNPAPAAIDFFGWSVAISGTTAVVGAYADDPAGSGSAYVFNATSGALIATLNNPDPIVDDFFGYSVAVSGNTAVVGAYKDDPGGVGNAGTVYVFDTVTGNLTATLNNPTPHLNDFFGASVGISGTTVVTGASEDESDGGTGTADAGRGYVFELTPIGDFSKPLTTTELINPDPDVDDWFGNSVATSGNRVVVGVPREETGGGPNNADAGKAHVYDAATGGLVVTIPNPAPAGGDNFGYSVAVSGNTIVAGAPFDDTGASDAGIAYVFNTETGALVSTLNNPAPAASDQFGWSVAVSSNIAVVGAPSDDPGGITNAGTAYVFDATAGSLIATLNNPAPTTLDNFGDSVAVSGNIAVVGAYLDDPGGVGNAGTAYVFNATTGALIATLNNPAPATFEEFGYSVAISGSTAIVGARRDNPGGVIDAGTAYVFDTTDGSLIATLNNPAPVTFDLFGDSVAVSGSTAVVGAHLDDPGGLSDSGSAYIFTTPECIRQAKTGGTGCKTAGACATEKAIDGEGGQLKFCSAGSYTVIAE